MRRHLSYANVMSTIAVFLVLGGGAYALSKNSVGSRHIKDNSVRSEDIRDRTIRSEDLRRNSVTAREVDARRFDMRRFVRMQSGGGQCKPVSFRFVRCGEVRLNLDEPGYVLLTGSGTQLIDAGESGPASGGCRFTGPGIDSAAFQVDSSSEVGSPDGFGMTTVTRQAIPPGLHDFSIRCNNESEGQPTFTTQISAVAIGGSP
jgi:hypothetical protein